MTKPILDDGKRTEILAILGVGCSRRVAAMYVGCHVGTIRNTARRDPEFAERLARAENQAELAFLQRIHKAAEKEQYWRAAAWALERINPEDFAARCPDTITHTQLQQLLEELTEIIAEEISDQALRQRIHERVTTLFDGMRES